MRATKFFRSGVVWIALMGWTLQLAGCGEKDEPDAVPAASGKDFIKFQLPESVLESAPLMQDHLHRLIPYNTSRFLIKPRFVFLEREEPIAGPLDIGVTRLNLLHMSYWRQGSELWNASVLLGLDRSVTLNSFYGYTIDLITKGEDIRFRLQDRQLELETSFHKDEDHEARLEDEDARLYLNYYVFPKSLVLGKESP